MNPPAPPRRLARACLLALVVLVPLAPLAPVEGAPLALKQLLFLGLTGLGAALLLVDLARGTALPALGTPVDKAFGAWLAVAGLSALTAVNRGLSAYALGLPLAFGLAYLVAVKTLRTRRAVLQLYLASLVPAVVIALLGLQGYADFVADGADEQARSMYLTAGVFPHSYLAAQYLVPILAGGVVLVLERGLAGRARLLVGLALVPVAAFLATTGSRGALLAVGLALVVSAGLRATAQNGDGGGGRRALLRVAGRAGVWLAVLAALGVLATVTGLASGAVGHAFDRLVLLFDPDKTDFNYSRLDVWRHSLDMAADHIFLGVGPGNFDSVLPSYHPGSRTIPHAHNQFVHVLAETGLAGLATFLFLVRHVRRTAVRGAHHLAADEARRAPFHAAVAALLASLVYFLYETPLLWVEAGSLVVLLLAVMSRAGCTTRDAVVPRGRLAAGTALVLGLLVVSAPAGLAYVRATRLGSRAEAAYAEALTTPDPAARRAAFERTLPWLEQAHTIFPHGGDFAALRAQALSNLDRRQEALEWYALADAAMPGSFELLNSMGSLWMKEAQPEAAIEPLRRAVIAHLGPESAASYARLAQAYLGTGRLEEAWTCYSTLIEAVHYETVQPTILLHAARTLVRLERNLHFARVMLERFLELQPDGASHPQYREMADKVAELLARDKREAEVARVVVPEVQ